MQTITKDMFVQEMTKVMFDQPFHLQLPHDQLLHLLLDQHDHLGQQDHLEQQNDPAQRDHLERLLLCHALLPHDQHDHLERLNDHALQQRLLLCHAIGTKLCCVLDIMNFFTFIFSKYFICLILQTLRTTTQAPNPCYPSVTNPPPCQYASTEHPDIAEWRRTRNRNKRPSYQSDQNQVCQSLFE